MSPRFFTSSSIARGAAALLVLTALSAAPAAVAAAPGMPPPTTTLSSQTPSLPGPLVVRPGSGSVAASGGLTVQLDPSTLQATPVAEGTRCRLSVRVVLGLTGTVDGTASGTTVAVVAAPCAEALATPPGTFADAFRFTGDFRGRISGIPSVARVEYLGLTRSGGEVSASLTLRGGAAVLAGVQARAGEGGTYRGVAQVTGPRS